MKAGGLLTDVFTLLSRTVTTSTSPLPSSLSVHYTVYHHSSFHSTIMSCLSV